MKKLLAIMMSAIMILCAMPVFGLAAEKSYQTPASGYASYDADAVAKGDYSDLSYDQIASILLDYVDRKIAAVAADFNSFEIDVMGQQIAVELNITSLDGILTYSSYLSQLGGDFANLDTSALNGLSRKNGDINFIYKVFEFVADNAQTFGKVFQWEEGQTFDFGKVGEYIESLPEDDEIRVFYNDYLIGNDIQQKFVDEIAREMNYTIADGETFDDVINNGILAVVTNLFKNLGLLSDEAADSVKADFNLRTTDVYTLVKNFVAVLQSDNQVKLDTYYTFYLDNLVRTALKLAFGYTPKTGEAVNDEAVVSEFKDVYKDLALLNELSNGKVNYRAADGKYYEVTISDTDVTEVKALTWENTMDLNFEAPTAGVYTAGNERTIAGKNCGLVQTYKPTGKPSINVYSTYINQVKPEDLPQTDLVAINYSADAVPEEYTALMTEENGKEMSELFAFTLDQGDKNLFEQVITFDQIEEYVEAQALPIAQQAAEGMGELPFIGKVTVDSVDVTLDYQGYATEDEFVVTVSATASAKVSPAMAQSMADTVLSAALSNYISNPVATIVVDNLSGSADIENAAALLNFVDSDFAVDRSVLDFSADYDKYDGVVGQVNHVACKVAQMLLSDEGYTELALVDGDNSNLTANVQKICDKANSLIESANSFMQDNNYGEFINDFIQSSGMGDFLSSADLYKLDFSSVENFYVCLIGLALDVAKPLAEENSTASEITAKLDGLTSLEQMAVVLTDCALEKAIPVVEDAVANLNKELGTSFTFSYAATETDPTSVTSDAQAKDVIMTKLTDLALYGLNFAVDCGNTLLNKAIDSLNADADLGLGHVNFKLGVQAGATWEETANAIVNRVVELSNGLLIVSGSIDETDTLYNKISAVANAVLPLGSMFSNCFSEKYACDFAKLMTVAFDETLAGNFDNFLALFEANNAEKGNKKDSVAVDVPVTYALIKSSDYIVDAFFPDTVQAELYTPSETVQEYFTSSESDNAIAARNMVSLNNRKTNIVPAVLDLVKESDILRSLVVLCEHANKVPVEAVPATCTATGFTAGEYCPDCENYVSGHDVIPVDPTAHTGPYTDVPAKAATCISKGNTAGKICTACGKLVEGNAVTPINPNNHVNTSFVKGTEASCTEAGYTDGIYCNDCGKYISGHEVIPATGHIDADGNDACDNCGEDLSKPMTFIERIKAFFDKILDWFRNLFK